MVVTAGFAALITNVSVVFDNNAYSGVGFERLRRIQTAEVARSVRPLASLVVAQELLAGVLDSDDDRRTRTRRALVRLWSHCQDVIDGRPIIRFIADIDSQIRKLHMGEQETDRELVDSFGSIVGEVGEILSSDLSADLSDFDEYLNFVSNHVAERETMYKRDMRAVANEINDGIRSILQYRAMAPMLLIERAISDPVQLEIALDPYRSDLIPVVSKLCAIGLDLHVETLSTIQRENASRVDPNTLWDEEICCATSLHSTINQSTVVLVTEEKKLRSSAAVAGAGDRVVSLCKYEYLLALEPWQRK